jgi:UDP-3-O-[3-hydroxymyristoyl] glucosamine N-acyltransferase
MIPMTAADLAARVGGVVSCGDPARTLTGVNTPDRATPTDLIFVTSAKHQEALHRSAAGAVLLSGALDVPDHMTAIRVAHPLLAMSKAIDILVPIARALAGVSERAVIGDDVEIAPDASIGPGVYVGDRTRIGARSEIRAGVTLGVGVTIGEDCVLYPGVRIYDHVRVGHRVILHAGAVIGADGFGYVPEPTPDRAASGEPFHYRKIRQVGTVVIEDDVEIGANSTIDRAMLSETRVGRGTKIDNLVMVGHNSVIGRHGMIVGQAGLSGSVEFGDYVTIAGQAGIRGHVRIGNRAVVGSQAGVIRDVPPDTSVLGFPAVEATRALKALPLIAHLPEIRRLVRALERRVSALEGAGDDAE